MKLARKLYPILLLVYLLGVKDGYLALWEAPGSKPIAVYQTKIEMFPKEDQKALRRGIPIRDELHLQQILEDYLS